MTDASSGAIGMSGAQEALPVASEHFFDLTKRMSGTETQSLGLDQRWLASVGVFTATNGFGEEAWVTEVPVTLLAQRLSGAPIVCRHGGARGRSTASADVTLQPRGSLNHYTAHGPVRFAQIYLEDSLIDRVADSLDPGACGGSGRLRDDLIFKADPVLAQMVESYVAAAFGLESTLELEARAILMVSRLLRTHHGLAAATHPKTQGGLAPWQLKRACEAMAASLDRDLGLSDLAAIAACSPAHFSRAFKQSTGLPPSQWLTERRIARAKELLVEPGASLAEVALAVGFSAQPQFTTAFRRATGTTPGAWRRERCV